MVATALAALAAACESPQPPAACGPAPQVTVNATEATTVSACFNDPNGDVLSYSVTSSDPAVATASNSGAEVTVNGISPGSASVTVTATDPGGLKGQQTFQVLVPNRAPEALGAISPITVEVGRTESVDVSSNFADPDEEALTFAAASSNEEMATVAVAGSTVTVAAIAKGTVTVTVTASDPAGLTAQQTFQATVPNRAPVTVGTIGELEVEMDTVANVNVAEYFDDPDGDPLAYAASSSSPAHASVSVSGSVVTVSGVLIGVATVTVTASDTEGAEARQSFAVEVLNPDRRFLGEIYDALGGDDWTVNTNWKTDAPLDEWYRVTTNDVGRVLQLDLRDNGLAGEIPAVVGRLRFLERLDLALNRVDEESPPGLPDRDDRRAPRRPLEDPSGVVASSPPKAARNASAGITGPIPPELGDLSGLRALWLGGNTLTGSIPPELGELADLESLWLADNQLGGSIPEELADLSRLAYLNLAENLLAGAIPAALTGLSRLRELALYDNALTGPIPPGLEEWSDLEYLGLAWNSLTGPLPRELGSLPNLQVLWLGGNSLTGPIPGELGELGSLEELFLYDNDLSGPIPPELGDLAKLENMWLHENELTGPLPPELGRLTLLEELYVSANQLGGEVPYSFLDLETLDWFWFGENGGLCAPAANVFTTWLAGMVAWSGPRCRGREPFDLEVGYTNRVSSTVRSHVDDAIDRWAAVLRETELPDITFDRYVSCGGLTGYVGTVDDHLIWVHVDEIDGKGGTLAYAGYCYWRVSDYSPIISHTVIDEADIDRMIDYDALVPVAFHEVAHGLGFSGHHFDLLDLLDEDEDDPHFEGGLAIEAFDDAGGEEYDGEKVPVQLRIHSHWRESVFGDEVMTPYIDLENDEDPISAVTLQAMADMGYEVDESLADDYELPDPSIPPPAEAFRGEGQGTVFDLGNDVVWGPVAVVDADGRVLRTIPPPPGALRWPPPRRGTRIESRRPPD